MFKLLRLKTIAAIGIILATMMLVFPTTVHAEAQIRSFTMESTVIAPGESTTFTVVTNNEANYVFAIVGGVRFQGEEDGTTAAGLPRWRVVVTLTATSDVVIFAGERNIQEGSANITVPITVTAAVPSPAGQDVTPAPAAATAAAQAAAPATGPLGPVAIHSVVESPSAALNTIRLTVITGTQAEYVWVRFDGNRFQTGTVIERNPESLTWVIDYRPQTTGQHQVQIGSNRIYDWRGASVRNLTVLANQPFSPPLTPIIQSAWATLTTIPTGTPVSIRVRTNAHVNNVWVRDINGNEIEARPISPTTATQRNWEVTLTPGRSGDVQVFANTDRHAVGAAMRTVSLQVGVQRAQIFDATATWQGAWTQSHLWSTSDTVVRVTTNHTASNVWLRRHDGSTLSLALVSGHGQGNRVWEVRTRINQLPITVHANAPGAAGLHDDSRTISNWNNVAGWTNVPGHGPGHGHGQWGWGTCPAGHNWPNQHCNWCRTFWWNQGWVQPPGHNIPWHPDLGWAWGSTGQVIRANDFIWIWNPATNAMQWWNWRTRQWGSTTPGHPGPAVPTPPPVVIGPQLSITGNNISTSHASAHVIVTLISPNGHAAPTISTTLPGAPFGTTPTAHVHSATHTRWVWEWGPFPGSAAPPGSFTVTVSQAGSGPSGTTFMQSLNINITNP